MQDGPKPPRATTPIGVREDDAYTAAPESGYQSTYLDGGGGIAGVPLTEEQREALIAEARRRGLSVTEAYALAYGDGVIVQPRKDGTVQVDTSQVKVPNHPVYIRAARPVTAPTGFEGVRDASAAKAQEDGQAHVSADRKAEGSDAQQERKKPGKAKEKSAKGKEAKPADEGYYPSSGINYYEEGAKGKDSGISSVLPPVLGSLVEEASEVTEFLSEASPGDVSVVGPVQRGSHVLMMMSAPLAEDLTVRTTIAAPVAVEAPVKPVVTTVAVDTSTGEVVAREENTCDQVAEVPAVAIGHVVDVVLEARQEMGPEVPPITPALVEEPETAVREEDW